MRARHTPVSSQDCPTRGDVSTVGGDVLDVLVALRDVLRDVLNGRDVRGGQAGHALLPPGDRVAGRRGVAGVDGHGATSSVDELGGELGQALGTTAAPRTATGR
ncbi:hypothetical protein FHR32_006842 [Streptosporangium album]|uniref:Uncharacterized protein n=1 Tax=Streptosporangium album TaxID=47479 RepID=A0A7W7S224_9ACTN|nr:hypothetical protein [Streptosporangium album]MBB4942456.1 hypothetical protein [Streptosporangium album]